MPVRLAPDEMCSFDVQVEGRVPCLCRHLAQRHKPVTAGAVDEDVDAPELIGRSLHEVCYRLLVLDVRRYRQAAASGRLLDPLGGGLEFRLGPRTDDDVCSVASQQLR